MNNKEYQRQWRKTTTGQKCTYYSNHKKKHKDYYLTIRGRYCSMKARSKQRNLPCTLTYEEYLPLALLSCFYCGNSQPTLGAGLDRINNLFGYTKDNVLPCCSYCNDMRGDKLTVEEMKLLWALRRSNYTVMKQENANDR